MDSQSGINVLLLTAVLSSTSLNAGEPPTAREAQVATAADGLRAKLSETRRDFHMHPELSGHEERTARVVTERLRTLGFDEIRPNVAGHGVVALLRGSQPGAVVAVRADMDALPITETIDVPYKSLVPGVKHACGHDAHTAVELGVAEVLAGMRGQIHGSVKFLFQPAEESAPSDELAGAALMIKEGALENPRPLAIFGLHSSPELEAGVIGFLAGPNSASSDGFTITIHGKMAHGASPQRSVDSIVVAAECVTALQSIRSRRLGAFDPVVLTIGTIHGGTRPNIIPDEVKMEGTVRTFDEDVRKRVEQLMRETLAGITAAYGARFDLDYQRGAAVVNNDPKLVAETLPCIRRAVGETKVVEVSKRMGSEDFSFYQQVVPGFFFRLGCGNKAKGITAGGHTPEFDIDEECLVTGTKVMADVLLDFLDRNQKPDERSSISNSQ